MGSARCAPGRGHLGEAFDAVAGNAAAVVRRPGREGDLISDHLAAAEVDVRASVAHHAGNHLVLLLKAELAVRQLPGTGNLDWNYPKVGAAPRGALAAGLDRLVRGPVAHVEGIRG